MICLEADSTQRPFLGRLLQEGQSWQGYYYCTQGRTKFSLDILEVKIRDGEESVRADLTFTIAKKGAWDVGDPPRFKWRSSEKPWAVIENQKKKRLRNDGNSLKSNGKAMKNNENLYKPLEDH